MVYATDSNDRVTSILLVMAIHLGLGAVLATGLRGEKFEPLADALTTFDVFEPIPETPLEEIPPPPLLDIPPPPDVPLLPAELLNRLPQLSLAAAPGAPAPPNILSAAAPVVAPTPVVPLPVPSPIRTAAVSSPTTGQDNTVGAAAIVGPGTGAGGAGQGFGGGGMGGMAAGGGGGLGREASYVPGSARARLARNIIRTAPARFGRLPLRLGITPAGRVGSCVPLSTSGSAILDTELCRSVAEHSRWIPAADRAGRPVAVELTFNATWSER